MALTFTQQARGNVGNKLFKAYSVLLDGSVTAITAANLDMHYIDTAVLTGVSIASNIAPYLCTTAGQSIDLGTTHANGDLLNLWVWGF